MLDENKKSAETYDLKLSDASYSVEDFEGFPQFIIKRIFGTPVAWAIWVAKIATIKRKIITLQKQETVKQIDIAMISTEEKYQRRGHAEDIVKQLQNQADIMRTSYTCSSTGGRKLMQKCGFKRVEDWMWWAKDPAVLKKIMKVAKK